MKRLTSWIGLFLLFYSARIFGQGTQGGFPPLPPTQALTSTPTITLHGKFPIDFAGDIGKTQMRLQDDLDKLVMIYKTQDNRGLKTLYKQNAYNNYHDYLGYNHAINLKKFLALLFSLKPQVIEQTKEEKALAQRIEVQEALIWLCGNGADIYKNVIEKIQPYVKDYSVENFEQVKSILKEAFSTSPKNK